jgi:inorganic phosphate transporter, PiT family
MFRVGTINGVLPGAILLVIIMIAVLDGSDDTAQELRSLVAAGEKRHRLAVLFGCLAALAGALLSLALADKLVSLYARGIVEVQPSIQFGAAVGIGAATWIVVASLTGLPLSTTTAVAGGLLGAAVFSSHARVHWDAILLRVVLPLVGTVMVSHFAGRLLRGRRSKGPPMRLPAWFRRVEARPAHWMASWAKALARGLNDAPKIVALGTFGLVPNLVKLPYLLGGVGVALALGGLVGGLWLTRHPGTELDSIRHGHAAQSKLYTAAITGAASVAGLPVSVHHLGAASMHGVNFSELALSWLAAPAAAACVAAVVLALITRLG